MSGGVRRGGGRAGAHELLAAARQGAGGPRPGHDARGAGPAPAPAHRGRLGGRSRPRSTPDDDPVAESGEQLGLAVVRGPLDDVLERYRLAAAEAACDAVVRITADCPLAEPAVIDRLIRVWREDERRSTTSGTRASRGRSRTGSMPRSSPGRALDEAAAETREPYDREHVTPFVRDRPDRFPQRSLRLEPPGADGEAEPRHRRGPGDDPGVHRAGGARRRPRRASSRRPAAAPPGWWSD